MLRTLPDRRRAVAEQRRTNAHVCRAVLDRLLQVAAHPGGDDDGLRVLVANPLAGTGEAREWRAHVASEWRHRHHAPEGQSGSERHGVGKITSEVRWHTSPVLLGGLVEV